MAGRPPQAITITDAQRAILEQIVRRQTSPQHQVRRARIVLLAAAGETNQRIAARLEVHREMVSVWRGRWAAAQSRLAAAEQTSDDLAGGEPVRGAAADGVRDVSAAATAGGVVAHTSGGGARVGAACAVAGGGLNGYIILMERKSGKDMTKQIKLMTEYGAHALWWHGATAREMNAYNLIPNTLPLRQATLARLRKWAETYDSILCWEDPASSGFSTKEEEEAFEQEGIALWKILREELGPDYHVVYHSWKYHKTLENPDEIDLEV